MRLSRPEWLVLPLFLLPLLAAGALALFARSAFLADARGWDLARVRAWIDEPDGPAREWADFFVQRVQAPVGAIRVEGDRGPALVVFPREALGDEMWRFSDRYPGGPSARMLADPAGRLALETGAAPPVDDRAAATFAALLAKPDLTKLRVSLLPPGTKRFLAARWGLAPGLATDVEALCDAAARIEAGLPVGIHPRGAWTVVATGERPIVMRTPPATTFATRRGDFVLRFNAPGPALWRARLESPLAGEWSVASAVGSWWESARVRKWAGPVGAGLSAFLVLPAALWIALRKQRRLDEARARFITEIAHDLRTPLTSVRMHAEMLATGRGRPERRDEYASVVAREAARLSGLLGNLLDLSRLERGARRFDCGPLDLAGVVATAARDFAALYPDRADDLDIGDLAGVRVVADRTALERCLGNLLDNAGKYTAAGTAIRLGWHDGALHVSDAGPGIPPAERASLFRRYTRGHRAQRDGVPGTGMGLALVRELAEGMGGSVACEDAGPGARFVVRLRRA